MIEPSAASMIDVMEDRVSRAAQTLGARLNTAPEMQAFVAAARALHADAAAQSVIRNIRERQAALQWRLSNQADAAEALSRLEAELETMPVFQAYRQAEQSARHMLTEVDEIISRAAGVAFAANGRRGCCGG
jgi:cell fate (sporulation/competence/biofilm development) regulator YlbF (YheA/YmcA/DUF963 family)